MRDYKLSTVISLIRAMRKIKKVKLKVPLNFSKSDTIKYPIDVFIGYLLFDCWISNPDRHHENWGFIVDESLNVFLAPTYDHASGLGCRISDEERVKRLETTDKGFSVETFVKRARTPFYDDNHQLKTDEAFYFAKKSNPNAANYWLNRLKEISESDLENIFIKVPKHLMSDAAKKFSKAILKANKKRLFHVL